MEIMSSSKFIKDKCKLLNVINYQNTVKSV